MICLSCGECCRGYTPLRPNEPQCDHLVSHGNVHFCAIHNECPEACQRYQFEASVCPIGMGALGITVSGVPARLQQVQDALFLWDACGKGEIIEN